MGKSEHVPSGLTPVPTEVRVVAALAYGAHGPGDLARIAGLLEIGVDWERFLAAVEWHRVAGLVHRTLAAHAFAGIPEEVKRTLGASAGRAAWQSMQAAMQLAKLAKSFAAEGIPVAVLKGIPLSLRLYGDLGVRQSRDIDLLVTREDVARADALLAAQGYRRLSPRLEETPDYLEWFVRHRIHFEYEHSQTRLQVELHWRLWERPELGSPEAGPELWQRLERKGLDLWVLPDEILLPYLCVHGAKHAWFRLKWLADVGEMVRQDPNAADRLLATAARWGAMIPAVQALRLCSELFGTEIPEAARKPGWPERTVTRMALTAIGEGAGRRTEVPELRFWRRLRLARLPLSRSPRYVLGELGEQVVSLGGWERLTHRQRAGRLLLWAPRWIWRKVRRRFSSAER